MRIYCALILLLLGACQKSEGLSYDNNDLELLTAYRAKELCSCLFVMDQSESYCTAWTVAAPNLATFRIDRNKKRVETVAGIMWSAAAYYEGERTGCIIE
jgi:hypothetical protein